jgi:hypothetical protein
LNNRWIIFQRPLVSPDSAVDIVKACVLYNFVSKRDGYKFEDWYENVPDEQSVLGRGGGGVNSEKFKE